MKKRDAFDADQSVNSRGLHEMFAAEEIKSLMEGIEHIGLACIDNRGNLVKKEVIESVGNDGQARSTKTIDEIGNKCKNNATIWWHTHVATLSSMSLEDRLTAGNLKLVSGSNIMCALGIEGFSCHDLSKTPPKIMSKKWDGTFFNKLKSSSTIVGTYDSDEKWKVRSTKEGTLDHMTCSTKDGVVICIGVDWKTGINHFPVGAFHQVIFTGNVDITPSENGFNMLASPVDEKLDCVSIKVGDDKKVLYCR
jgi:hypothetical protein